MDANRVNLQGQRIAGKSAEVWNPLVREVLGILYLGFPRLRVENVELANICIPKECGMTSCIRNHLPCRDFNRRTAHTTLAENHSFER